MQELKTEFNHSEFISEESTTQPPETIIDKRMENLVKSVGPALAPLIPDYGPWYKCKHMLKLNFLMCVLCLAAAANGYDNSLINSVQAFPTWDVDLMKVPRDEWLGFIVVTLAIGSLVGNVIAPILSDRFGRLLGIRIGTIGYIAFAIGQSLCKTDTQYIICRTFIGLSVSFATQAVVLIAELSFPTYRGFFTCFYMTMYYAGSFLSAWVAYGSRNLGDWSWRAVGIVQAAFPLFMCFFIFTSIPESPRWLMSKGREDKAREVLYKMHGGGDPKFDEMVEVEIQEIIMQLDANSSSATLISMFKGRENLWKSFITITLGIFQQWNGVGVISYYLISVLNSVGITNVTDQTLINGFLQFWNFICASYGAFTVDKHGRRFLFLWSTIGMLISYIILTGLSAAYAEEGNKQAGIAVVVFLFIYYGHYDVAWTPLVTCYPVEIWPYHQRAKGFAMQQLSNYGALLVNQFVNPIALGKIAWRYYFVYIGILIIMLVVIWFFYPETKGHSLEEVQDIFRGSKGKEQEEP